MEMNNLAEGKTRTIIEDGQGFPTQITDWSNHEGSQPRMIDLPNERNCRIPALLWTIDQCFLFPCLNDNPLYNYAVSVTLQYIEYMEEGQTTLLSGHIFQEHNNLHQSLIEQTVHNPDHKSCHDQCPPWMWQLRVALPMHSGTRHISSFYRQGN